ncbi:hypothetical protein EDC04DRAFT_1221477 [Pisolithus marmoratus]|nr:hypothetical protein EDC04DRAFT_1221477 [Pisolithus marmoratus]
MKHLSLASIGSSEQGEPGVVRDSPVGSLVGSVPPWRSELCNAVSGYDNDQRDGEVPCETFQRPPSEYEATQQPHQDYLQIYDIGRFRTTPPPTLAARSDVPISPINAGDTWVANQYDPCGWMANGIACASNSPAVDMTTSPAHHDGAYHLFNSHPNHYYSSPAMASSSHVPPSSSSASPMASAQYVASESSESSACLRSLPVRIGSGPQALAIPASGYPVADYDPRLVGIPRHEAYFYLCSFDTCQEWISDDRELMVDHLADIHRIYLRGDPDSSIECRWKGCTSAMKKGNFLRHVLTHLEVRWECSVCKKSRTRSDSVVAHIKLSKKCVGGTPTKLVSPKAYRRQMFGDEVAMTKVLGG